MPLINFRSDLTTLQYGADRPGGGASGQPYVVSPNPNTTPIGTTFQNYYTGNRVGFDFPIRGGIIEQGSLTGVFATPAGKIDRARIQAFLNDGSRGRIFLEKQKGLQLSNPNIQVPPVAFFQQGQTSAAEVFITPTRLYSDSGANLLAQVEGQGTGVHFERHGRTLRIINPFQQTYEYYASRNNEQSTNRLAILAALKLQTNPAITRNRAERQQQGAGSITALQFANAAKYGISTLNTQILDYQGGPGSVYGIGKTTINRAVDTTDAHTKAQTMYNAFTMTYAQLATQNTTQGSQKWNPKLQDFRNQLGGQIASDVYDNRTAWYNNQGNPGKVPSTSRIQYGKSTVIGVDPLNAQVPIVYDSAKNSPWDGCDTQTKDIIKFMFECLSNDGVTGESNMAVALVFRAFLTGFTDNHQAEYNSFKYLGRGETFRTYQGFDRSISFSFKIAAQSKDEMKPLYRKLNHLVSQVYPDYNDSGLMRGSVIKLTVGDYLYRVPGFLESVNITVADEYPWEIAPNQVLSRLKQTQKANNAAPVNTNAAPKVSKYTKSSTIDASKVRDLPSGAIITTSTSGAGRTVVVDADDNEIGTLTPLNQRATEFKFAPLPNDQSNVIQGRKRAAGAPTRSDLEQNQLPQVLDVQCSFRPIHDFLPQREKSGGKLVPLIGDAGNYLGGINFLKDVVWASDKNVNANENIVNGVYIGPQ